MKHNGKTKQKYYSSRVLFYRTGRQNKNGYFRNHKKDSLSAFDTKAVRILTNVYDALISPVPENYEHHLEDYNNDRVEESQGI